MSDRILETLDHCQSGRGLLCKEIDLSRRVGAKNAVGRPQVQKLAELWPNIYSRAVPNSEFFLHDPTKECGRTRTSFRIRLMCSFLLGNCLFVLKRVLLSIISRFSKEETCWRPQIFICIVIRAQEQHV